MQNESVTKEQNQDGGETMQRVAKDYDFGNVTAGHSKRRSENEKWCSARASKEGKIDIL